MKAIVKEIQVGGGRTYKSLEDACKEYVDMISRQGSYRAKIAFIIKIPNGDIKSITIRDEDKETVAYGDFDGLPSFLDYSKETVEDITLQAMTRKEHKEYHTDKLKRARGR